MAALRIISWIRSRIPPPVTTGGAVESESSALRFAKESVEHPTTAGVWPRPPTVSEDIYVLTPGLFKGICQHRHVLESPLLVQSLSELHNCRSHPAFLDRHGPEGVAEDVTEQETGGLLHPLSDDPIYGVSSFNQRHI